MLFVKQEIDANKMCVFNNYFSKSSACLLYIDVVTLFMYNAVKSFFDIAIICSNYVKSF